MRGIGLIESNHKIVSACYSDRFLCFPGCADVYPALLGWAFSCCEIPFASVVNCWRNGLFSPEIGRTGASGQVFIAARQSHASDNVLYHSRLGLASERFRATCPEVAVFVELPSSSEIRKL